jgi:uncharacterized integral membrane protein (TIGR00698 family)
MPTTKTWPATGVATVCGAGSLLLLPLIATRLGLTGEALGFWAGASVNDVGQAVATASFGGVAGLEIGVVSKLARVSLLAPLLVLLGVVSRRRRARAGDAAVPTTIPLPWFVVAFLVAATIRSTGALPAAVVDVARVLEGALLGAGLVGVGAAVDLRAIRGGGLRPLVLAGVAWFTVAFGGLLAALVLIDR